MYLSSSARWPSPSSLGAPGDGILAHLGHLCPSDFSLTEPFPGAALLLLPALGPPRQVGLPRLGQPSRKRRTGDNSLPQTAPPPLRHCPDHFPLPWASHPAVWLCISWGPERTGFLFGLTGAEAGRGQGRDLLQGQSVRPLCSPSSNCLVQSATLLCGH